MPTQQLFKVRKHWWCQHNNYLKFENIDDDNTSDANIGDANIDDNTTTIIII